MTDLVNDSFGDQPDTSELTDEQTERYILAASFAKRLEDIVHQLLAHPDAHAFLKAYGENKAALLIERDRLTIQLPERTDEVSVGNYL